MKKIIYSLLILFGASHVVGRSPQMPRGIAIQHKKDEDRKKGLEKPKEVTRTGWFGLQKKPTLSTMPYSDLKKTKDQYLAAKNWDLAAKYLHQMIKRCEEDELKDNNSANRDSTSERASLIIELADTLFKNQKLDEATKWYKELTQFYPGNEHVEYASYKVVICASKKLLSYDRDQTPTEEAIELANDFLKRSDICDTYKKEVIQIRNECYTLLAQSECDRVKYYLNHGNYSAAERRLKSVREEFLEKAPIIQPVLIDLEITLASLWKEFKAPQEALQVAQALPSKKTDMTKRF